jgi:hypothetical protein
MHIIDHGEWETYKSSQHPRGLPGNVLFCRRVSDKRDWYEFQSALKNDNIKLTVYRQVVMTTTHDASSLFPADMRVLEIVGFSDDHETLRQQRYDGKTFLPALPPPVDKASFLIALHRAGLLTKWRDYVAGLDDVPLQIILSSERPVMMDSKHIQRAAGDLGFSDGMLRQLFAAAMKET